MNPDAAKSQAGIVASQAARDCVLWQEVDLGRGVALFGREKAPGKAMAFAGLLHGFPTGAMSPVGIVHENAHWGSARRELCLRQVSVSNRQVAVPSIAHLAGTF